MVMTTIDELFDGPWGIVKDRRREIEDGHFGSFDRIYEEEVAKNFLPIQKVAEMLGCHESTARDWLRRCDARYIVRGLAHLHFRLDVKKAKVKLNARKVEEAARKLERKAG